MVFPTLGLCCVFVLRKFLTGWTNVSTALSAVKGLLAEMRQLRRAPQAGEKLVQRIGPDGPPTQGMPR
ncbi:conserved hypothetical protein [Mesorhizobium ventifaucium]|uniref:Uncharacterized protein n=1 Tax=Mesorhizobium ventifaucium TaxID=666020 RepID=A0ABM9EEK1_9HYPH|nr:conserved hypothetical protein [Mesorhizobium ventifaucium]